MNTKYASPEKTDDRNLRLQCSWFNEDRLLGEVLNAIPDIIFVLNEQRQIVFVNASINKGFNNIVIENVIGNRPGEVLNCEYAFKEEGGCGTSEFCRTCGAVNSVLSSIKGKKSVEECRILQRNSHESLDLRVFASPITLNETNFTVFTVTDISDEKRKQALEKIFFHDILNTAGGLKNLAELMKDDSLNITPEVKLLLLETAERIVEEISTQKELSDAESNTLSIYPTFFNSFDVIKDVIKLLRNHESGRNKKLSIGLLSENIKLLTDKALLRRILINLIKNALEASQEKEEVITSCILKDGMIEFTVWNSCFIPKHIQNQIFMRSFSTKGRGRGLGTYSIRLLTEQYLGGKVFFTSSLENGTFFTVKIPVSLNT